MRRPVNAACTQAVPSAARTWCEWGKRPGSARWHTCRQAVRPQPLDRQAQPKTAAPPPSYGATVYEIYSPHATWSRVRTLSQGANVFIYLGHGNGWPSPYGPFQTYTKDGLGLNASDGSSTNKYYGEYYVSRYLNFAPNSVVILNRLCYASGNNEWGSGYPTKSTAIKRVDNYGAGFL